MQVKWKQDLYHMTKTIIYSHAWKLKEHELFKRIKGMFQQMEFYVFKQIKIFLKFYWIWDLIEQTGSNVYHAPFF
jgi:hypothetical protein